MERKKPGTVMRLFECVFGSSDRLSWGQLNGALHDCLKLAIQAQMPFHKDDFFEIHKAWDGGYWMGTPTEPLYSLCVEAGNLSACQSYENWYGRPPFMYESKRLHIGSKLKWESMDAEVTSFGEDHRGWHIGCCSYKKTTDGYRGKIDKRFNVHLDELRKGEREKEPPKREGLLLECMKLFKDIFYNQECTTLKKFRTLKDLWDGWPYAQDFERVVRVLQLPVPHHRVESWRTADEARADLKDFDTKILPIIKEHLKRRKEAAKEKKAQNQGGNHVDR